MATAKNNSGPPQSKARIAVYVIIFFALVLLAVFLYNFAFIKGQLNVGTAYGARVACSCHYIGGRDITDCEKDFEPGMEVIGLSLDDEKKRVTASAPFLASATAEFREGWGCIMLSEKDLAQD